MAEARNNNYANIEKIDSLLGAEGIGSLLKSVQGTEKKVNEILRRIADLEGEARRRAQEESAREEAEAAEQVAVQEEAAQKQEPEIPEQVSVQEPERPRTEEKEEPVSVSADIAVPEKKEENTAVTEKEEMPQPPQKTEAVKPAPVKMDAEKSAPVAEAKPARPAPEVVTQRKNGIEEKIIRTQYADRRERAAAVQRM